MCFIPVTDLNTVRLTVDHSLVAEDYFNNPRNGMKVKPIENSVPLRPKLITVTKSNKVN